MQVLPEQVGRLGAGHVWASLLSGTNAHQPRGAVRPAPCRVASDPEGIDATGFTVA